MRRQLGWALACAAVMGAGLSARGCGAQDGEPQPASGGGAGVEASAGGTGAGWTLPESGSPGGTAGMAPVICPDTPPPPDVPEGWVRFPVFGCKYKVYVPPEPSLLPPPLEWEECTDLGPDPYTCTQLVTPWPHNGQPVGGIPRAWKDENGKVVLQFRQMSSTTQTHAYTAIAAYADGPTLQAFRVSEQAGNFGLSLMSSGGASPPSRATWRFTDYFSQEEYVSEIRGGPTSEPAPILIVRYEKGDVLSAGAYGGPKYVALVGARLHIRDWEGSDLGQQYVGLDIMNTSWANADTLIWGAHSIPKSMLYRWTPTTGAEALHGFGDDFTKGAASPATDGTDIVWLEGEGRDVTQSQDLFPTMRIMTAKLTAGGLSDTRPVRSWPGTTIWESGAVGCDHAAYYMGVAALDQRLFIVRLSDGVSWTLKSPADNHWNWGVPLAVDCNEVTVTWGVGFGTTHIRRIRLDSLGPGTPPD